MEAVLNKDKIKTELEGMVEQAKQSAQKEQDKKLSPQELKSLDDKRKADKESADKKLAEAEAKAKADAAILSKKPEERSDDEKKRAAELEDAKRKDEESRLSADEKIKRAKDETQKRIDEMSNELKLVKDQTSKEAEALKDEIKALKSQNEDLSKRLSKTPAEKDELASQLNRLEAERVGRYLEADRTLPREQRREISKDELDEWILEDLPAAQVWLTRREIRRAQEKTGDTQQIQAKSQAEEMARKQMESLGRVLKRHKDLDDKTSEKAKLFAQIINEDRGKYLFSETGPELAAEEMERRIDAKSKQPAQSDEQKRIEELEAELAEVKAMIQNPQDNGINSTLRRSAKSDTGKLTEAEEMMVDIMRKNSLPEENVQAALKAYRERQGKKNA